MASHHQRYDDHELLKAAIKQWGEKLEEKLEEQKVLIEKMGADIKSTEEKLEEQKILIEKIGATLKSLEEKDEKQQKVQLKKGECSTTRSLASQSKPRDSRKFKLEFEGKLLETLYSGNNIQAEGPSPIKLSLLDAITGQRVIEDQLSSVKVSFVVLPGDFKNENWTQNEFNNNILSAREGKKPLLIGQLDVALQDGMGSVEGIIITDSSNWQKTNKFRLGAIVEAGKDQVREAVSNAFQVKHKRGEKSQKHPDPNLEDEVWRLERISINGKIHKKLAENGIYKVKDLLALYDQNESLLLQIVGEKEYKLIIQHATKVRKSSECPNRPNDSTPSDAPTSCPLTNSGWGSVPEYHMTTRAHDQQANQIIHNCDHNHQMNQIMVLNDPLHEDSLARSCTDVISSLMHSPPIPSMLNGETSSWLSPSMMTEGNDFYLECSSNSDIGMSTCNSNASVNHSLLSSVPSMPNSQTSSCLAPSMMTGGNNFYFGCSSNSDVGMSTSISSASVNHSLLPSIPSMPNSQTSSCLAPSMMTGGNDFYMGCSSNFDIGMSTYNTSAGVDISGTKEDRIKTRAVRNVSTEHDEAVLKKGKFPRHS